MPKRSIETTSLHVKDIIRRVQSELIESQKEREDNKEPALFVVDKLTLEVNFTVTETTGVGGKFDLKVITADSAKTVEAQQVHKITLTLTANPGITSSKGKNQKQGSGSSGGRRIEEDLIGSIPGKLPSFPDRP